MKMMAFTENILWSWRKRLFGLLLVLLYIAATSKGDILDLTLVTNHPVLGPPNTDNQFIAAYLGEKNANLRDSIKFGRTVKTADSSRFPEAITIDEEPGVTKRQFKEPNQNITIGAFNATVEREGTTYTASIPILLSHSTILPEQTTLTAHTGDTVSLAVQTGLTNPDLRWRFNQNGIDDSRKKHTLTLHNVGLDQSGVYKCFLAGNRWLPDQQAIMILHIIRCPAGRWGPDCEQNCTECLNGGKCDADSGECVCPPGFNGTNCEHVLGSNRFGQDGSFSCDLSGDDHGPGCRGKLFCLPDPFGCTCAAGFMGINCTTECNPGTYGGNCLQECHCSPPNTCAKDTGICTDGNECEEGWTGVNCQVPSSRSSDSDPAIPVTIPSSVATSAANPVTATPVTTPATTPSTTPAAAMPGTTPPSTHTYAIESFNYSKVNNGEPTNLVCVVKGTPPPPTGNVSVVNTVSGGERIVFQGTIFTGSTRTVSYQVNVRLDEVPQNYSCLFHRPDGSSVSKELSVSVYEPPWFRFNGANILVQETSSDSITISWRPWDETRDNGDGPVIGYRIYYNIHGENNPQRASNDIITDTVYTITNLIRDTEYDFGVTAVREGLGGEGPNSSMASFSTRCNAPSEAPALTVSNTGRTFIRLSWMLIPEHSWGCGTLSGIQITLSKDEQIEIQRNFSATMTYATITGLEVCTRYSITAAFFNKDNFGFRSATLLASTSMTPPERIAGLQTSPSTTQIEVNWENSTTLCPPDYYIIRYSLYQRLACPSLETFPTVFEVNTTSPKHNNLADLAPYSRYRISVVAVNGAGRSEPFISYANTSSGPPPIVTNVMVDQERTSPTSLRFTWQPLTCENVNGPFRYYYTRIYTDFTRASEPVGREYFHDRTSSSVEFDNLEKCTMYELNIYVVIGPHAGDVSRAIGVTGISFTDAYTYVSLYQPNSLTVSWSVPSQCNVDYYKLSYQLISRKACPDVPVIDTPRYELNVTSMLTDVSKRLSNLEYYSTYAISIIAVIRSAQSLPRNVSGHTAEGEPSPLQSVSYTSTDVSLHFMWEDPSCENRHDTIRRYEYDLYNIDDGRTVRSVSHATGNDVQISNLDACTRYRFRVKVVTTSYRRSDWYIETAFTDISAPGMPSITQLTQLQDEVGGTGLTVSWQPPTWPRCQPTHYEIQYYLRQNDSCEDVPSDPQLMLAGVVDGSNFTFQIDKLRPNSEYMVFVRGNTTSGYGDWDSRAGTTGYSYPSGPPTNIGLSLTKKRSIIFTWEKPECGDRNGPITRYDVILCDSTGFVVHQETVTKNQRLGYEISDLTPYTNYSIKIRAWNYELAGVYSQEVWAQTDEARPGPPENVTLPSSDQESITVEWMSPNPPLGRIIGYYILYWETEVADATSSNVSIPCRNGRCSNINYRFLGIIPNLQSDTNYSVQVQAETSLGVGAPSPSEPAVRITSEGIPSEPQDVGISTVSKSSLMITWKQPKYPRGRIVSYTLAYKVKGKPYDSSFQPGDSFKWKDIDGSETRFLLESLEPATLYEVYVVASTSKGEGDSSLHVKGFTAPPPAEELPKPNPPVIVVPPAGLPTIHFSDVLQSPYITNVLVAVEERLPVARRRRSQPQYGSYAENPFSYLAANISKDELPVKFTIGDNNTYGNYHNAPLKDNAIYDIRTGVESNIGGQKSVVFGDSAEVQRSPKGGSNSIVPVVIGIIFAVLLVTLVVVGVLYYRRKKGKFSRLPASILRPRRTPPIRGHNRNHDNVPMRHVHSLNRGGTLANTSSVDALCNADISGVDGAIYANLQPEHNQHTPIPLDQLVTYVAQKKASVKNGFKHDYESIPVGQLHPWDVAKKIENKQKNRYINIIAYDHSRVQLPFLENDPHSDYINASFIDGYNYPRKYIAAQGPNVASVKDFWRMVWEEDCRKIVMLTNLVEGEKKKCEKYWPEKKMLYGKITVTMKSTEVNTHYTVRTFTVVFDDTLREVVQFHYTSWPDMGVPKYTTPLMNFIRTVKQHHTDSTGAIIVHCSAGVGRTGTFITLDAMLDQAEAENAIDVYNFIMGMRQNRIKMVQVLEQYQFIYDALLETFVCGDTSIAQDLFLQRYPSLLTPSPDTGSTLLQEQFERLDMFTIKPREDELRAARNPMNIHKNRYPDKIPTDKSRPYLITEADDGTNYINASFLPGYTKKDMFLGTQTPLPSTVGDFWRLVFDYKISTVVMLNGMSSEDETMAEYWPDASQREVSYGPFTITLINEEQYDEISCRTLELRSTTSKSRVQTVNQMQLTTWPVSSDICTSAISMIELHRRAMMWNDGKDIPILVHCKDGEGPTGTFCALSSVLERLNVEKLVDVFQACKRLRAIRPGAVESLAQYEFIHSVLRLYLDSYDIYENYHS